MKKLTILGQFLIVISVMMLTVGCSSSDEDSSSPDGSVDYASQVRSLDLSGAQGLYITGDVSSSGTPAPLRSQAYSADSIEKAASAVDLDANSIYKITADGRLERVAIEDENGNELPRASVRPALIQDLNSLYLLMFLEVGADDQERGLATPFLVHKATGFAYNASEVIYSAAKNSEGVYGALGLGIQWDENNNFYVKRPKIGSDDINFEAIYKIDTSTLGSGSLTVAEIPSAYSFQNTKWMVDKTGKFIVFGGEIDSPVRYLSIVTGAIHNINEDIPLTFEPNWIQGLDNKVYTYVSDGTWYRIESDSINQPLITEVAKTNDQPMHWALYPETRYVIGGKLIYITGDTSSFGIEEIDTVNGTVFHHFDSFSSLFQFGGVKKYVVSDNYVYVYGTLSSTAANGFYKYDVVARTGTSISVESGFDVQKFTVLADDRFLVEGIRLSDQAYFYGELATDGTVSVTSTVAIGAPTVLLMEAIRPADFMLIDGSEADWSIDLRTLTDASGDGTADGDLLYYSQTTTSTQYFGMIEHGTDLNRSYYVHVVFDSGETLQFKDDNATLLPDTSLSGAGGIASRGSVIEFSMPLDTVTTANAVSVELFGTTASGDINTSDSIDRMPN